MIVKLKEKELAIRFRKEGLSYNEILRKVPVAKSSLSLWLRSVGLSEKQKQRLTKKKLSSMRRGWEAVHKKKVLITKVIKSKARKEIGKLSKRELWLIGIALYWSEGHKEKDKGSLVRLGNSDPRLIKTFLKWLFGTWKIKKKNIIFRIYLHETSKNRLEEVKKYWSKNTGFSEKYFDKITWKKNKIKTNRKNIGKDYYGLLDIGVRGSINLNRQIQGWIEGICNHCRVV